MTEIESLIYKFIWDNKAERIKRTTLQNDKCQGGLGLTNIYQLNACIKITWVTRTLGDTGSFSNLLLTDLPTPKTYNLLKYMLQSNLKHTDIQYFIKTKFVYVPFKHIKM